MTGFGCPRRAIAAHAAMFQTSGDCQGLIMCPLTARRARAASECASSIDTGALEMLGYDGTESYLCVSPGGRRVSFTGDVFGKDHQDTKANLLEKNGKPREIKLKLLE